MYFTEKQQKQKLITQLKAIDPAEMLILRAYDNDYDHDIYKAQDLYTKNKVFR